LRIFIDGGTHKSRICLVDQKHGKEIVKQRSGNPTNNELEYLALLYALSYIQTNKIRARRITILSDSKLVVMQVNREWKVNNPRLDLLKTKCQKKMGSNIKIKWIGRNKNKAGIILDKMRKMDYYRLRSKNARNRQ